MNVNENPALAATSNRGDSKEESPAMLSNALEYASRGWPVFPCKPGEKIPATPHGFKDATTDTSQIRAWWQQWPDANIGIPTGAVSRLVVLDVDVKNDQPGANTFYELQREHGQLKTLTSKTPSGGWHLLFEYPGSEIKNRAGILPGLDIRGDGGYIVAPGSSTEAGAYAWQNDVAPTRLPTGLLKLLTDKPSRTDGAVKQFDRLGVLDGVHEGQRDDAMYRYACSLQASGVNQREARELVKLAAASCTPPFDEATALEKVVRAYDEYGDPPQPFSRDELASMIDDMEPQDMDALEDINRKIANSDLSRIARDFLHKKMKKKTGVNLSALRADIGSERTELDQQELVERTITRIGHDNVLYAMDYFWLWNPDGVWNKRDDRAIKQHVHTVLGEAEQEYGKGAVDSVLDLVKTETFRDGHRFDLDDATINTLSGELHLEAGQWALKPHDKEKYRTTQIPVAYQPDANAPRFLQFLSEVFAGDPDGEDKASMVLELIGYTLLPTCRFERFALLIGSGANGKSVLLGVLEALLGREYVVAVQPSQFDNRFQRAHLQGKLANIVTEIAEGAEIADAQLKAIVSGELITAEHKHKPPFDFHPVSTCWFGTNHMPHTRDFSDALFRRAVILNFNNTFKGERCDTHLKDKLLAELPGILNLALGAVLGVLERGEFTNCQSNEDAKRAWRVEADQAAQFVDECCNLDSRYKVLSRDLYCEYAVWADSAGIRKKLNRKNFTQRLSRLGVATVKGAGGSRWLHGIRLDSDYSGASGVKIEQGYKPWRE